jgi:hypothetical protein
MSVLARTATSPNAALIAEVDRAMVVDVQTEAHRLYATVWQTLNAGFPAQAFKAMAVSRTRRAGSKPVLDFTVREGAFMAGPSY